MARSDGDSWDLATSVGSTATGSTAAGTAFCVWLWAWLWASEAATAALTGALGAARGAELRRLPINKERAGAMPLPFSPNSSSKRPRYFSLTQSRTKRLGA